MEFVRRISAIILLVTVVAVTPLVSARTWVDAAYLADDWPRGNAPLGFGNDDIRTAVTPGRITYYFKRLFYFPAESQRASFDRITLRVHCSDGVVGWVYSREAGRSPSLPPGNVDYETRAAYADPDGIQEFDVSWLLTACENGLEGNYRALTVEVHRVDPDAPDFRFDAELVAESGGSPVYLARLQSRWLWWPEGETPPAFPAETVGTLLYPMTGMPAVTAAGNTVTVRCRGDAAELRFIAANASCAGRLTTAGDPVTDDGETWIPLTVPPDMPPGLYDLWGIQRDEWFREPVCLALLPELSGDLSIVHVTDSHIPFRGDYAPDNAAIYSRALATIDTLAPDLVIHTGDGYNEGNMRDQAELFLDTFSECRSPILYTPGNHELGEWCGDGSSRYNTWELFGWPRLDPTRSDHYPRITRDYIIDAGPISFFCLETWINYTSYWMPWYATTSLLMPQIEWLRTEAAARENQAMRIACYHHDFADQLQTELPDLGFALGLSGHTHEHSETHAGDTLLLKTAATYSDPRPLRWLRIEDGQLTEYPVIRLDTLDVTVDPPEPQAGYSAVITIANHETCELDGLKRWITLAPDMHYTVSGGELLGEWDTGRGKLLGIQYDLPGSGSRELVIQPAAPLPDVSFHADITPPFCTAGQPVTVMVTLAARNFPYDVDAYILLHTGNAYYFWPDWTESPRSVSFRLPLGQLDPFPLLTFTWPDIPPMGEKMEFLSILLDSRTGRQLTPLYTSTAWY